MSDYNRITLDVSDRLHPKAQQLCEAIDAALIQWMTEFGGFSQELACEFSNIYIWQEEPGEVRIRLGAEISLEGFMRLFEKLNPIVESIDKDAYFDMYDACCAVCVVRM